jgi:hypothetical protein
MKVVQVHFAFGDEFLPDTNGEWKIGHSVSVEMTKLLSSEIKENHSAAVRFQVTPDHIPSSR